MKRPVFHKLLADLWLKEYGRKHHCCICGNRGWIDTRNRVFTPAGKECGDLVWCMCPNGRAFKDQMGDFPPEAVTGPSAKPGSYFSK